MIVVTWNVNSIKVRLPNVLQYLKQFKPDILALQETKKIDQNFQAKEIKTSVYNCYFYCQKTYNGVSILAKTKCKNIEANPVAIDKLEARSIALTYGDLSLIHI